MKRVWFQLFMSPLHGRGPTAFVLRSNILTRNFESLDFFRAAGLREPIEPTG